MLSLILFITSAIVAQNVEQSKLTRDGKVDLTSVFKETIEDLEYTSVPADPQEYFKKRLSEIADLKDPYPHKFNTTRSLENFVTEFNKLENSMFSPELVAVAGRIHHTEKANHNYTFYYLKQDGVLIQVLENERATKLRKGDIMGCIGNPGKTDNGTLVIIARDVQLLAPCLHEYPNNVEESKVPRYLNFIINEGTKQKFYTRAKIIQYIRQFLDNMGFLEVETPILNEIPGGAMAKPFKTHYEDFNDDFFLRISPELFHKMLVIGGFDRVYEIGRQFRNEGTDPTHNPEFTSCEFYMAYADYNDLMEITENLLSGLVEMLFGSLKIKYHPNGPAGEEVEVDFTPPFERIQMMPTLEKYLNVTLPPPEKLDTPESNALFNRICDQYNVSCGHPRTITKMIDSLAVNFIHKKCIKPTFIIDYPQMTSPLAKYHRDYPGLSERFELYILTKEVCNAYTELNDPVFQREQFARQDKDRAAGDDEIPLTDEDFITAMEYGLPPTAGWGIGIDRLAMILTDSTSIKEVLLFPAQKSESVN